MTTVVMMLVNSHDCKLDTVEIKVQDPEDCSREVMAALSREKWVLSVGDRIELREHDGENAG